MKAAGWWRCREATSRSTIATMRRDVSWNDQVDLHPENGVVTKTFRYQYTYAANQSQPDQVTLPDGSVVHRAPQQGVTESHPQWK